MDLIVFEFLGENDLNVDFQFFLVLYASECHNVCMVAFFIEFRSFRYIICYFWWLVQGVLVLKAKEIFF